MRRYAMLALVLVVLVGVVLVAGLVIAPAANRCHVNALIERYSSSPDQETADKLAGLLDWGRVPPEQGGRILKMLLTPRVAVRETYRSDRPVCVTMNRPFWLHFPRMTLNSREWYLPQDTGGPSSSTSGGYGGGGSGVDPLPVYREISTGNLADGSRVAIAQVGTYTASIRYEYDLYAPSSKEGDSPLYTCRIEIPLEIRVVQPDEAEKVNLVSGKELDRQMKAAFRLESHPGGSGHSTREVAYETRPAFEITYLPLSENVAFRARYRDASGFTKPFPEFVLLQRAGHRWPAFEPRWSAWISLSQLRLEEGDYRGTLILEADEAAAYRDSAMKAIWDGVLQFPIEFHVTKVERAPASE
jgi:hypothetical protein